MYYIKEASEEWLKYSFINEQCECETVNIDIFISSRTKQRSAVTIEWLTEDRTAVYQPEGSWPSFYVACILDYSSKLLLFFAFSSYEQKKFRQFSIFFLVIFDNFSFSFTVVRKLINIIWFLPLICTMHCGGTPCCCLCVNGFLSHFWALNILVCLSLLHIYFVLYTQRYPSLGKSLYILYIP